MENAFVRFGVYGACHIVFEYGSVKKSDGNLSGKTVAQVPSSRFMSRPVRAPTSFSCPPRASRSCGPLAVGLICLAPLGLIFAKPTRMSDLFDLVFMGHVTLFLSTKLVKKQSSSRMCLRRVWRLWACGLSFWLDWFYNGCAGITTVLRWCQAFDRYRLGVSFRRCLQLGLLPAGRVPILALGRLGS